MPPHPPAAPHPRVLTYNVGARQATAFLSADKRPDFAEKLKADVMMITFSCDVACLQEVNRHWRAQIEHWLPPGFIAKRPASKPSPRARASLLE